ncbi:MAG: LPS export ABC transporter periplasmic protein LptC [Helicobacteraceae bacterium CG2_30_36_10]|nr:MAG: LPS export ABC transporter periplasmic protein LptC [Helicobacteraceae bacterium CG2_30_36_10]
MIFFLFKPLNIKEQKFTDVPLFELSAFTMHELNIYGLQTLMLGDKGARYKDRYTVKNIDYTDNSRSYLANMRADFGVYKNEIVNLDGNVFYSREDGLVFETQKVIYNKKTSIAYVNQDYVSYRDNNKIIGTSLEYNNFLNQVKSTDVVANYHIEEKK